MQGSNSMIVYWKHNTGFIPWGYTVVNNVHGCLISLSVGWSVPCQKVGTTCTKSSFQENTK